MQTVSLCWLTDVVRFVEDDEKTVAHCLQISLVNSRRIGDATEESIKN